ncbi:MAG: hypothetical protein DHS20C18_00130 [Saprospiraceae bacterium]|nr:MAG: hypothetical protein DHS20C18_00130 [Saprospiraceae bacterium]
MRFFTPQLAFLWLFFPFLLTAQPYPIIEIHGRLLEQIDSQRKGIGGVNVYIYENGQTRSNIQTEGDGRFSFKLAVKKSEFKIEIHPQDYRIVIPHEGILDMPTSGGKVEIEILVVGHNTTPEMEKKMEALSSKVSRLKAKNQLSQRQIDALSRTMLDTIAFYENQRLAYEKSIEQLKTKVAADQQIKQALQDSLVRKQQQLLKLQSQVDQLTQQLFIALEEQYLRQKKYFDDISSGLSNYIIHLKDFWDLLPNVKYYFSSNESAQIYNATANRYSNSFININDNYQAYLEGVKRYWKPPEVGRELSATFDYLLVKLHKETLLPATKNMNNFLQNRNLNKAQKAGAEAYESLTPMVEKLEKDIELIIAKLGDKM